MSLTLYYGLKTPDFLFSTFRQLWKKKTDFSSKSDLMNKVVIVTGGNRGIGKECVKDLVKRGATVIMACRNIEKGLRTKEEIEKVCGIFEKIEIIKIDLSSLKSVREFVEEFRKKYENLHILINNAGIIKADEYFTSEGNETFIASNYLGHFLLTNLLVDLLKKSAPSRVINVSSSYHYIVNDMTFNDFQLKNHWVKPTQLYRYGRSKAANVMFSKEFNDKYQENGITSFSCHPGVVKTELFDSYQWKSELMDYFFVKVASFWMKSADEGAKSILYCCLAPESEIIPGEYYDSTKLVQMSKLAKNKENRERLWEISSKLVNLA
ncbi:DgyrCDS8772 [Dimorphilus gyrociliatus]|uniref:DgyrCDS8772 n=1 Tax=Dimorphilus gyrociliatus TaxID=2664684 RepID=A0A7I8VWM1_9ANNE|nr:DgyrCDS8772 [Dimorphilus gyrociliatus]